MTIETEGEAVADVLTGAVVAHAVQGGASPDSGVAQPSCQNCKAALSGPFCAQCGQAAHIHRSLASLAHDILHGVFHFEGRIWRTVPELFFHPGRLTRRYVEGERAKFVSPMALFLFMVFLTFAALSLMVEAEGPAQNADVVAAGSRPGNTSVIEATDAKLEELRKRRADPALSPDERSRLDGKISGIESARSVVEALRSRDWERLEHGPRHASQAQGAESGTTNTRSRLVMSQVGRRLLDGLGNNPDLLVYKLKTNGYKYSWALVPLSVPFIWVLFFWRRDIHLYDHAVFVSYSISFMMLLVVTCTAAATAGVYGRIWGMALAFIPPVHLYKQLRGAYALSRLGALVRLFFLLIAIALVLSLFVILLVMLGRLD